MKYLKDLLQLIYIMVIAMFISYAATWGAIEATKHAGITIAIGYKDTDQ